ncbi:hypothetical protein PssvBMR6_gp50 [Pseudomonas phage MR6]|uniref:Holin n=1 Tax=Pseudomonas phage MR5 TaxID=2711172 RepID=A0A6M3TCR8_9CAUD|nr:hypothetical protein PssvBMR5_gp50 [Pseudomonas phage MR5]QJD54878.1 hypothetical protein PssvBMR6_gp50 [Pseudomonas phage MR6]QJD54939.1 hypothetical protein PssvBMR7_gp52 [Pseudomonas phage MR7]QJD54996.1 putative DNA maturase [Pseudomonas phage MR8]QJD55053.1 putative DNA maturase [Pseudomonas phage MR12]QJD55356.1 hypothetical protein PssvBMR18_gp48 [Pseudomonas phage MR18]QJF74620.1 hypothetical protein PssvBMR16_gp51 [Pseudomonas phage MR16]
MSIKEVVLDRAATASPSLGYLGMWASGVSIQNVVAVMTGVLVACQIVKTVMELRNMRIKRKEAEHVTTKQAD